MKLRKMLKEAIKAGPTSGDVWGWEMARALNSLANDIDKSKHDNQLKWAKTYHRTVPDTLKLIERLHKLVKKMK